MTVAAGTEAGLGADAWRARTPQRALRASAADRDAWVLVVFFGLTYVLASQVSPGHPLRWCVYALPAISLALMLAPPRKRLHFDPRFVWAVLIYASIAGAALLVGGGPRQNGVRDVLIISGALLTFVPRFRVELPHLRAMTVVFAVAPILQIATGRAALGSGIDFASSQGLLESASAFPLAMLTVAFAARGDRRWAGIAAVLSVLTFKRIALAGIVGAGGFLLLFGIASARTSPRTRAIASMAVTVSVVVVLMFASVNAVSVIDAIDERVELGKHPDRYTLGRYSTIKTIEKAMPTDGLGRAFGSGPGTSTQATFTPPGSRGHNPHNDFLKLRFEYGLVGLAGYLLMMTIVYGGTPLTASLLVLNAFLMMTDNTVIYLFHQFTALLIVRHVQGLSVHAGV